MVSRTTIALVVVVVIIAIIIALLFIMSMGSPGGVVNIEVEADDYYFDPRNITIPLGSVVRLTISNEVRAPHTFTVSEYGIDVNVNPGMSQTISFTANRAGVFRIICRYHVNLGMVGWLIVK